MEKNETGVKHTEQEMENKWNQTAQGCTWESGYNQNVGIRSGVV